MEKLSIQNREKIQKKSLMPCGKRDLYINLLYSAKNIVLHTN